MIHTAYFLLQNFSSQLKCVNIISLEKNDIIFFVINYGNLYSNNFNVMKAAKKPALPWYMPTENKELNKEINELHRKLNDQSLLLKNLLRTNLNLLKSVDISNTVLF